MDKKWYCCPECGQKILKKGDGAKSEEIYIKCKKCGKEIEIKIGEMSHEPNQV